MENIEQSQLQQEKNEELILDEIQEVESHVDNEYNFGIGCSTPF